ncbi:MAG: AAA family ATPase [Desulfobacterales bacterium]|nr:AAA family ATPase [Desulfobacterales bacterium]
MKCLECQFDNPDGFKFCGSCGHPLETKEYKTSSTIEGERKHVTIMFSDLSGYTAMTERLDPEEVKEIMSHIFSKITAIIKSYDGFIERFIGDAVMAVFGVPQSHEDDPIRAIRAAMEIHTTVEGISPKFEERIGRSLTMHTGINTGLVVTGEVDVGKGTHGLTGDAINTAARLQNLARKNQIFVGYETYRQTEGHFDFEELDTKKIRGKEEPVSVYRVLSPKERPVTIHRLSGMRANLIGRKDEMSRLNNALTNLREGKGSVFLICGDAGTGKSRLVKDFKASLNNDEVQFLEGHAYAYAQNTPYFLLIDLLTRAFRIRETDPPEKIKEKIHLRTKELIGKAGEIVPFIGSLYSLSYPELEDISPDLLKYRLEEGVKVILTALAKKIPTILFLEDLHWADTSVLSFLHQVLTEIHHPIFVICSYRPPFSLFTILQSSVQLENYHEIRLLDFSAVETQEMVGSLLKSGSLPPGLEKFLQDKTEGNPFYLEELINSLIESDILKQHDGKWLLTRQISELNISSTVHGVISARLDRLEKAAKRILQEASVIGRVFLYDILNRVTEFKGQIDKCLNGLESLDLIRKRGLPPDLEYVFKHALTQEAVYNGLLKKERQELHERTGLVIEQIFHDRLPEFYEILALHFKQGQSVTRAVNYLMKAGQKDFSKCAMEESNNNYKEAFELLSQKMPQSKEKDTLLIDLLNEWAFPLLWEGRYSELINLFERYEGLSVSLGDKKRLGMFFSQLGIALCWKEKFTESYSYLRKALDLGEQMRSLKIIGHTCFRLAATCANLGRLDEAVNFGKRAQKISKNLKADLPLHRVALGLGSAYWYKGDIRMLRELGNELLNEGKRKSDPRHLSMAEAAIGLSNFLAGNFQLAIQNFKASLGLSKDHFALSNIA